MSSPLVPPFHLAALTLALLLPACERGDTSRDAPPRSQEPVVAVAGATASEKPAIDDVEVIVHSATPTSHIGALVVGEWLYYATLASDSVWRVNKNGGEPVLVGPHDSGPDAEVLQYDEKRHAVNWLFYEHTYKTNSLFSSNVDSLERKEYTLPAGGALIVSRETADYSYSANYGCEALVRLDKNTGEYQIAHSERYAGAAALLALDDQYLYCGDVRTIVRFPLDFSSLEAELIYTHPGQDNGRLSGLIAYEGSLYFIVAHDVYQLDPQTFDVDRVFTFSGLTIPSLPQLDAQTGCLYLSEPPWNIFYSCTPPPAFEFHQLVHREDIKGLPTFDEQYVYWPEMSQMVRVPKPQPNVDAGG